MNTPWVLDMDGLRRRLSFGALFRGGVLDLSSVTFVRPGGMVGLSALIEGWTEKRGTLEVLLPPDEVLSYMHRMNVLEHLGDRLVHDRDLSGLDNRCRHPASLLELRRVCTEDEFGDVTEQFHRLLSGGELSRSEVGYCCKVLSESLENTVHHAQSGGGAYTAIQTYRMDGRKKVCVAVADSGLGIPETLRDHAEAVARRVRTDSDLVQLSTMDGISRFGDSRGGGLASALRSVGRGSGGLVIWSGEGWVRFSGKNGSPEKRRVHAFGGTCLEAIFPVA